MFWQRFKQVLLDTSLFRLSYIICLFFTMLLYVTDAAYIVTGVLFVWGMFLVLWSVFKTKSVRKLYFAFWLIAFIASLFVTVLVNINSDIKTLSYNIVMLMHCCICFFVFYGMHTEKNVPFKWELYLIIRVIVYLSTVTVVVGLLLMLVTKGSYDDYIYYRGTFTGLYVNPNFQGYISAVSIISCHMLTKKNFIAQSGQKRVSRIWLASCVALNVVALFLCDSNGSLLLLIVYAALMVLIKLFSMVEDLTPKKIIIRVVALIAAGVLILSLMMFVRLVCRLGLAAVTTTGNGLSGEHIESLIKESLFVPQKDTGFTSRLWLWETGLDIFATRPLFGIGKGNLYHSIIDFSGRTDYNCTLHGFGAISASDLHNGYLSLLVLSGVFGFVLFMIFLLRTVRMTVPVWYVQRRIMDYSVYPCLLAFLGAYLVYAVIEKTILFDITFMVLSFWLVLGNISCYAIEFGYNIRGRYRLKNLSFSKRML